MLPFDGCINVHPCQVKSAGKNPKTFEIHMRYSKSLSPSHTGQLVHKKESSKLRTNHVTKYFL